MLQEKLRLSKEERDIVTKAAIKHFNTLINGYHPMLTVKKDPDCSYLKLQMDGFDELCYYILLDEYDDGTPFYLIYYGRLNWGGLPNWQSPDKKCDSLQSVGIAIAEHYVNYIWNENESLRFKDINMDKKLEARIARLEKMACIKNESDEPDEYDTDITVLLKEYIKAARAFSDAAEQIMYWTKHEYHQYNNDRSKKDYYLWEDIHDNSLLFIPDYSDNEDLISFVKEYI